MEANVTARKREVDAVVLLKEAETKVAEARAKRDSMDMEATARREEMEMMFSLLQKRRELEKQGSIKPLLIGRLLSGGELRDNPGLK